MDVKSLPCSHELTSFADKLKLYFFKIRTLIYWSMRIITWIGSAFRDHFYVMKIVFCLCHRCLPNQAGPWCSDVVGHELETLAQVPQGNVGKEPFSPLLEVKESDFSVDFRLMLLIDLCDLSSLIYAVWKPKGEFLWTDKEFVPFFYFSFFSVSQASDISGKHCFQ